MIPMRHTEAGARCSLVLSEPSKDAVIERWLRYEQLLLNSLFKLAVFCG